MGLAARVEGETVAEVIVLPFLGDWTDEAVQAYCESIGLAGTWIRTAYDGGIRGKYAGIGDTYDPVLDEFVSPAAPTE